MFYLFRKNVDLLFGPSVMTEESMMVADLVATDVSDFRLLSWYPSKVKAEYGILYPYLCHPQGLVKHVRFPGSESL